MFHRAPNGELRALLDSLQHLGLEYKDTSWRKTYHHVTLTVQWRKLIANQNADNQYQPFFGEVEPSPGPRQSKDVKIYWEIGGSLEQELQNYENISYWKSLTVNGHVYYDINTGMNEHNKLEQLQKDVESKKMKDCTIVLDLKDRY